VTEQSQKQGDSIDTLFSEKNPDHSHCDDNDITSIKGSKIPSTYDNEKSKSNQKIKKYLTPLISPQNKHATKMLRKNFSMFGQGEQLSGGLASGRPKKSTFSLTIDQGRTPSQFQGNNFPTNLMGPRDSNSTMGITSIMSQDKASSDLIRLSDTADRKPLNTINELASGQGVNAMNIKVSEASESSFPNGEDLSRDSETPC
jgi:hypothetical protein